MIYKRGDIILAWIPYVDRRQLKKRPALVVQSDSISTELSGVNVLIAPITSEMRRSGFSCRVTLMRGTPNFARLHLVQDSVVMVDKIFAIDVNSVERKLGDIAMSQVDAALRIVFDL